MISTIGLEKEPEKEAVAELVVRNLEDSVKARLKLRAKRHGRSMEEEARHILRNALTSEAQPAQRLGSRIAARFERVGLTEDLPELRGQRVQKPDFR